MKSLKNIREASGGKEAYMKFFNSLLKKFGADSPSELKGDKKTKFFNALDKGWDGDNEADESIAEKVKAKPGKFSGRGKDYFEIDIVSLKTKVTSSFDLVWLSLFFSYVFILRK